MISTSPYTWVCSLFKSYPKLRIFSFSAFPIKALFSVSDKIGRDITT